MLFIDIFYSNGVYEVYLCRINREGFGWKLKTNRAS